MTSTMQKSLAVAAIHVALVGSLGAKLLVDRATRPMVWTRAFPYDPNLPIRGRYVRIRIDATLDQPPPQTGGMMRVTLTAQNDRLTATSVNDSASGGVSGFLTMENGENHVRLSQPVAYFIPEHVPDPSRREVGEELWVQVTIPRAGAPRPIRLGVKKDGVLTPLNVQ